MPNKKPDVFRGILHLSAPCRWNEHLDCLTPLCFFSRSLKLEFSNCKKSLTDAILCIFGFLLYSDSHGFFLNELLYSCSKCKLCSP